MFLRYRFDNNNKREDANAMTWKPSVIIVGAGLSGLCAAAKLKKELNIEATVFELEKDVGGTWLVNTYPGCACDVPSHLYSFSFEPSTSWNKKYAGQEEILDYLRMVANKYDVMRHIQFQTEVRKIHWNDEQKHYEVDVSKVGTNDLVRHVAEVVISGPGALRIPNYPEKFRSFKGPSFHTAKWDKSVNLEGKKVAIIGSGASAIQVVPAIAPKVKELLVYQRSPSWIVPRRNYNYYTIVKKFFEYVPYSQYLYRSAIFLYNELTFLTFGRNTWLTETMSKVALRLATRHRVTSIQDDELREKLTPKYQMGCKRILVSDDFYPAMQRDNVRLITDGIERVVDDGIITAKGKEDIDVLILATGFDVGYLGYVTAYMAPAKVEGENGANFDGIINNIQTYLGICMTKYPNMYLLLGPNTGLGHNSVIFMIECQVDFALQAIKKMMEDNLATLEVKESVQREFSQQLKMNLKNTVFATKCDSWYADANGDVYTLWGGNCISYWNHTKEFDINHFESTPRAKKNV
ncbi:putative flavoprotein involved in K+ transport [Planoprotostelium fungivorum]|uniref:Putative flavoprotein involved in K+ transport n=1 Tax=Planoprotostelium fungivorum TaxID=1890364 RepID=A0A2P6NWV7_9EUKA|nr:putative flavoprotein involved in K+ transport [Planoprotostelium fungivorum]